MKAGYLKRISVILGEKYDDDIPNSFEELVKLPGIGPKMVGYNINRSCFNLLLMYLVLFNDAMRME